MGWRMNEVLISTWSLQGISPDRARENRCRRLAGRTGSPTDLFNQVKFAFPCAGALEVLVPMGKDMPEGWKIMRPADHSVVEDCLWGRTTFNEKYGFSMPKSFDAIQGEEIYRTDDELKQIKGN
jgi:hypothetical protein